MGNSQPNPLEFKSEDWQIQKNTTQSHFYRPVRHKTSGIEGQLYKFGMRQTSDIKQELIGYQARNSPLARNNVRIIGANIDKAGFGFCGKMCEANIITQKIPKLLRDLPQISNESKQNIILYSALKGFKNTYQRTGYSHINDGMIGFNQNGQTKVWLNQNFGMNYSVGQKSLDQKQYVQNQRGMVQNLVDVVKSKFQCNPMRKQFLNQVAICRTFDEGQELIKRKSGTPIAQLEANRILWQQYRQPQVIEQVRTSYQQPVQASTYEPVQTNSYYKPASQPTSTLHYNPPSSESYRISEQPAMQGSTYKTTTTNYQPTSTNYQTSSIKPRITFNTTSIK